MMSGGRVIIVLMIALAILIGNGGVAYAQTLLYEGIAYHKAYCYLNTGTLNNITYTMAGSASTINVSVTGFNETLTINTGATTYNVSTPMGVYGDSLIVAYIADDLNITGSGGRISLTIDTGHNSTTAIRFAVSTFFDGNANGMVWYRADIEWSNDQVTWGGSTIFYNVSIINETIDLPYSIVYAHGRYIRLNMTMIWLPTTVTTTIGNAYMILYIDNIASLCWPATPRALVEYRIYDNMFDVNMTLPSPNYAIIDYIVRTYTINFTVESRNAIVHVNLTAPLQISNYNLTFILDHAGNTLQYKVDDTNIIIAMQAISQNITLIYTREGRVAGLQWLPPETVIMLFDFGDHIGVPAAQGWVSYGDLAGTVVKDPDRNDISLRSTVTLPSIRFSGGWTHNTAIIPEGNYTIITSIRTQLNPIFFIDQISVYIDFYGTGGLVTSINLLSSTTFLTDDVYSTTISLSDTVNVINLFITGIGNVGTSVWFRWLAVVGSHDIDYNASFIGQGTYMSEQTIILNGNYYVLLPYYQNVSMMQYTDVTGYISIQPNTMLSISPPLISPITNITSMASNVVMINDTIIVPISANMSNVRMQVLVEIIQLYAQVLPDPPLPNAHIIITLLNGTIPINVINTTTNTTGWATANITLPATGNYTLIILTIEWPYISSQRFTVIPDLVIVDFESNPYYQRKNTTKQVVFNARFKYSGLPFNGTITFTTHPLIVLDSYTVATNVTGYGVLNLTTPAQSGIYWITAANAATGTILFPAEGNNTVVATGAKITITASPAHSPWYVYQAIRWTIQALYDDGKPAYGDGYIIVEKDTYVVSNLTWSGGATTITLDSAGYDNYLFVVLVEPDGSLVSNYSLVVALPRVNVSIGNVTVNGSGLLAGVEMMGVEIETYQMAALKDGLYVMILLALTLAPYLFQR